MDGVELTFDEAVYDYIVDKAIEYKLGARGLRSIAEDIMIDAMFRIPSTGERALHITLDYAREKVEKSEIKRRSVA
jgi:ATP-dependent Clp protease ATP-binding subunit ClpX